MKLSKAQLRQTWDSDRAWERRRLGKWLLLTALLFLFSLCFRYNAYYFSDKFVPITYARNLGLALRQWAMHAGEPALATEEAVYYYGAIARLRTTVLALVSGAALSVAGAVFQNIYHNPMASPNMLGATAGVKLGNLLVVVLYSAAAVERVVLRYQYCYLFTALCVVLVLLLGRLAGVRHSEVNILETVMAGSIVSQFFNVFTQYFVYNLEDEDLLVYEEITQGTYIQTDDFSMLLFAGAMAAGLVPIMLLRWRMNSAGLSEAESRAAGVRTGPVRMVGQLCGVLLVTAAMIHCGDVGMISMMIPYAIRQKMGADFRSVCVYSALAGGCLLMVCRLAASFFLIADEPLPVNFILNLVLVPIFLMILARRGGASNGA